MLFVLSAFLCKMAKYLRSHIALSVTCLMEKTDITGGVEKYLHLVDFSIYAFQLVFLSCMFMVFLERCSSLKKITIINRLICFTFG